jgi:hypothetical protein
MSRKLKRVEMDFSMTTQELVKQVKATEVVIMTVLMIIQTTICSTLTTAKVSMQVQACHHVILTRRMHHWCQAKLSSTMNNLSTGMTFPAEWRP